MQHRKVKLHDTDKLKYGYSDECFKAPNGKYYSTKEVWEYNVHQNELRLKCLARLAEYMDYDAKFLPTIANLRVKEYKDQYGYDVLLETLEENEAAIRRALNTVDFNSEVGKVQYIFGIVKNNIVPVYKRKKAAIKHEEWVDSFNPPEDLEVETKKQKVRDISRFVEDD